jgi:hypothetical protein
MFASPGIRKDKRNDQELGEDATGFMCTDDYAILWIADGAPKANIEFEGSNINSRKLAKCMGECFETVAAKHVKENTQLNNVLDDEFLDKFTNELDKNLSGLLNGVNEYLRRNIDSLNHDEMLEIDINGEEKIDRIKRFTTFVGAIIDAKNKICYTMSMGDCIALVNDGSILKELEITTEKANRSPNECSIKADLDSFKELIKNCSHFKTIGNIDSIILMSDCDINFEFENNDVETSWGNLKSMNNKTDDDKTAIFFKIME